MSLLGAIVGGLVSGAFDHIPKYKAMLEIECDKVAAETGYENLATFIERMKRLGAID